MHVFLQARRLSLLASLTIRQALAEVTRSKAAAVGVHS
jgi:hypothetical protein